MPKARLIRALLALTGALCAAGTAAADPAAWRIAGKHGGEITFLGSMHVLRATDYPLPATIDTLFARADVLVMELDLDATDPATQQATIMRAATLPHGHRAARCRGSEGLRTGAAAHARHGHRPLAARAVRALVPVDRDLGLWAAQVRLRGRTRSRAIPAAQIARGAQADRRARDARDADRDFRRAAARHRSKPCSSKR